MVIKVSRRSDRTKWNLPGGTSEKFVSELVDILSRKEADFATTYLREELLSKYLDPKKVSPMTRARAGVTKWLSAEHRNEVTNNRIMHANACNPDFGWTDWDKFVSRTRARISFVLGTVPDVSAMKAEVSNGASTRVKRSPTASLLKLQGKCHVSSSALTHFLEFWTDKSVTLENWDEQDSSTMFTVVKKSDIDRVACKEPEGNMLLQRMVGIHIGNRLRRKTGINLHDQTRNQRLARQGSRDGTLATIDLSSASDSITSMLVMTLLPSEWWSLLDDIRVKFTRIPGRLLGTSEDRIHELNMFSSMGNGFTFELETLIFWALTQTIREFSLGKSDHSVVSVYGDDIICSSKLVPRITRIFDFVGFKLNLKKTNYGPKNKFRESCGGHYYDGFDVSPFYIRGAIQTLPELILILNELLAWDGRAFKAFGDEHLARFHKKWSRVVPSRFHGGVDTSEVGALVTGHAPRLSLTPVSRPLDVSDMDTARYLKSHIDLDRLEGTVNPVKIRKVRDKITVSSSAPTKVVGFVPKAHPERGVGRRTTWDPYLLFEDLTDSDRSLR